jgi:glc operon protein GlcG
MRPDQTEASTAISCALRLWEIGEIGGRVVKRGRLAVSERKTLCDLGMVTVHATARYRVPTLVFERRLAMGSFNAYLPSLEADFIASRGGNPLIVDGKVIGAIGVSDGAGSQDDTISQAGAAALK